MKYRLSKPARRLHCDACVLVKKTIEATSADLPANEACGAALGKPIDNSDNANSIVLLLGHGPFRFFAGGDLT